MPDPITRAKSYPFRIPPHSYRFVDGRAEPHVPRPDELAGRTPVIACGSNQSPDHLARKYAGFSRGGTVAFPVTRARLADFDVVYSAHISRYGSIPATLHHCPGATVTLAVLWLTGDQIAHMHPTETTGETYAYVRLERLRLIAEGAGPLDEAYAYVSLHGAQWIGGRPVGLAEVPAEGRPHPALRQPEMQAAVCRRLAPCRPLDAFIAENVSDEAVRRRRIRALNAEARPFDYPATTRVVG